MKPFSSHPNPALAADVVLFGYNERKLSVLLLNRKDEPFAGSWTLPGAFLQMTETLEQACMRVLQTRLGLSGIYLEQLYTLDAPQRDPRGRAISVSYYALINPAHFKVTAGKMANEAQWFGVAEMPALGFDHDAIFRMALQRLRAKILYFPVGFELLDELFTMSELHGLYECILNTEIDRRNFARKILDAQFIINTGTKREGGKNRHPELFRFNKALKQAAFSLNIQVP